MDIAEKVKEVTKILDELDDYYDNLPNLQQHNDYEISDLYHYIEKNTLSTKQCYRMIKLLKEKLKIRRQYKNEYEMFRVLRQHLNKLIEKNNRKMLLSELGKKEKQLNSEYNNRVYTEEDLEEKLGG